VLIVCVHECMCLLCELCMCVHVHECMCMGVYVRCA
jgi:hypothetical protein